MQEAQLVIAREYGFVNWNWLKEVVLHQGQDRKSTSAKELLFKILRTPDLTQADIQHVEELITADPSLVSAEDENGRTSIEAVASRALINFGKEQ